jgi:outer membrane protein
MKPLVFLVLLLVGSTVQAQESPFYLELGAGRIALSDSGALQTAGGIMNGGSVTISDSTALAVGLGFYIDRHVAISLTLSLPPPTAYIDSAGSLAKQGRLGSMSYYPATFSVHYHFLPLNRIRPFIGAGVMRLVVLSTEDAALNNLRVESHYGPTVHAGTEIMLSPRVGITLNLQKALLETHATGKLGQASVDSSLWLNPLILNTGLTFRF